MSRRPPPLSLALSDHPLYSEILQIGKTGGKIVDLGCGTGRDLFGLVRDGVVVTNVLGVDSEAQFRTTFDFASRGEGLSPPPQLILGDLTTLLPGGTPTSDFESWWEANKGTFSVVICNRLLHLLPPAQHAPFLALLFSFLAPTASSSLLIVGLQRALSSSESSGYRSISASPTETDAEKHWLWNETDWPTLLDTACQQQVDRDLEWGSEFLPPSEGMGEGRGAERWWIRIKPTRRNALG